MHCMQYTVEQCSAVQFSAQLCCAVKKVLPCYGTLHPLRTLELAIMGKKRARPLVAWQRLALLMKEAVARGHLDTNQALVMDRTFDSEDIACAFGCILCIVLGLAISPWLNKLVCICLTAAVLSVRGRQL